MSASQDIRPSPIAGLWYTSNPEQLRRQINQYLAQAELPELAGEVVALIAPHAGYRYSGRTAGYAFRAVSGRQYEQVVVLSPFHGYHPAPLLVSAHAAYQTPLGTVPVDRQAIESLDQRLSTRLTPISRDEEHSLEIELPFLQCALAGPFRLLPVMMRSQSPQTARMLGEALAQELTGRSALLVGSTDLSHFYDQQEADRLDAEMLRQIADFSPEGMLQAEREGKGFACGVAPVAALLWAAHHLGGNQVHILHHSTSGDVTGDRSSVVGYGAAVILKTA